MLLRVTVVLVLVLLASAGTGAAGDVDEVVPGPCLSRAQFKWEVEQLLMALHHVMGQVEPASVLLPLHAHALNQFPAMAHHMLSLFEPREVGTAAHAFLRSIPLSYETVSVHKLTVVWQLLHDGLLHHSDLRGELFDTLIRLLLVHMNRSTEERRLCVVVANRLVDLVHNDPLPAHTWSLAMLLPELCVATRHLVSGARAAADTGGPGVAGVVGSDLHPGAWGGGATGEWDSCR